MSYIDEIKKGREERLAKLRHATELIEPHQELFRETTNLFNKYLGAIIETISMGGERNDGLYRRFYK